MNINLWIDHRNNAMAPVIVRTIHLTLLRSKRSLPIVLWSVSLIIEIKNESPLASWIALWINSTFVIICLYESSICSV